MNEHEDELLELLEYEWNEMEISFEWRGGQWYVQFSFKNGNHYEEYPIKSFRGIGPALLKWAEAGIEYMKNENGA